MLLILLVVAYSTFFTLYQTKQALVVRLGQPVRVVTEPGLNAKIPFIDSVTCIRSLIRSVGHITRAYALLDVKAGGLSLYPQSPAPGFGEKYCSLSGFPSHSLESAGALS